MAGDIFKIKQGDLRPALNATLTDATGNPVSLTTASSVVLWMVSQSTGAAKISGSACVVVSAADGVVDYQWAGSDTSLADTFNVEIVVTFNDGSTETFPGDGYNTVIVTAHLA